MVLASNRLYRPSAARQSGSALLLVLVVSSVLLLAGLALSFTVSIEQRVSGFDRNRKAARYVAELGLKQGEDTLRNIASPDYAFELDATAVEGRIAHAGDQLPLHLSDRALNRNGLVLYRSPAGGGAQPLYRIAVAVQGGTARYSVWVRNNADDFGADVTTDQDDVIQLTSLGEILDANGGVTARAFLTETLRVSEGARGNYEQLGFGAGGANTIMLP